MTQYAIGARGALLLLLLAACSSCQGWPSGLIYTHTVEPLTTNFDRTPVVRERAGKGEGDIKQIRYYVEVDWDANGIGVIAKENGFEEIYYADRVVLSVLGIWTQTFVRVYGKLKPAPSG